MGRRWMELVHASWVIPHVYTRTIVEWAEARDENRKERGQRLEAGNLEPFFPA